MTKTPTTPTLSKSEMIYLSGKTTLNKRFSKLSRQKQLLINYHMKTVSKIKFIVKILETSNT